ncbi:kinesin-like protein Klp5 [Podila epigama]|nr:kinesin-like protein Klp5 [Podila epigama]
MASASDRPNPGSQSNATSEETPQWPSESAILVAVRVRPFSEAELARLPATPASKFNFTADASLSGIGSAYDGYSPASHNNSSGSIRKVVDVLDERVLVFDPPDAESISKYKRALLPVQAYRRFKDMRYAFDRVFHEDSQQQEVFENTTKHLIDGVLDGYNGTLFAYGATGCGKTHTISGTPEKPGIIFLTMQELYERIKAQEDEKTIEISLSYLEVYNETIRDLLVPINPDGPKPATLHLREDSAKKISIAGLSEHHPKDMNALMELVFMGNANRTISPTEANATSSRSHAVLQINICQRPKTADVSEDFTVATLSLIDLAGSERASSTKNRGSRLIEGANINKSLLALGNCINALCDNKPKTHIPYRDSKLTRLLKFSLGGNCKTVMIACVSPSSQHYEEIHNTLKYANRAKNIKTKVTKNTLNVDRHVSEYVQVIYELRQEVAELKGKLHNQAKSEELERSQQKQAALAREFDDMVHKMRATFQAARTHETGYAQLQSQMAITAAHLVGLHRWRARFEEALEATEAEHRNLELERRLRIQLGENEDDDEDEWNARVKKLDSAKSASSSYMTMVDNLVQELQTKSIAQHQQMQEQEDTLKLYAVSIEALEQKPATGFPYQRLYELEKKYQALQSHNQILTTKVKVMEQSLVDQFEATNDFMELSARSLVGLRSEIEAVEGAGLETRALNDIYMSSITSFTEMTTRIANTLSRDRTMKDNSTLEQKFGESAGPNHFQGPKGTKLMSLLPEVPQTPVKKQTTSHLLPNMSMDTVDTKLAFGSSSLFGKQSPIRVFQERGRLQSPQRAPPSPVPFRIGNVLPRKKSSPLPGVLFSPKKPRARGGLRQPRLAPTPTKRNVNFLLDIVDEDAERYTTGMHKPTLPPSKIPRTPSQSPPQRDLMSLGPPLLASPSESTLSKPGMMSGPRRMGPQNPNGIAGKPRRVTLPGGLGPLPGSGGASNVSSTSGSGAAGGSVGTVHTNASGPGQSNGKKQVRSELQMGPQRMQLAAGSSSKFSSPPVKHSRSTENDTAIMGHGKKLKSSPQSKHQVIPQSLRLMSTSGLTFGLPSSSSSPSTSSLIPSPPKRARAIDSDVQQGNGKRAKTGSPSKLATEISPTPAAPLHISAATVARIARRRSMLPEALNANVGSSSSGDDGGGGTSISNSNNGSSSNSSGGGGRVARRRSMLPGPLHRGSLFKSSPVVTSHEI